MMDLAIKIVRRFGDSIVRIQESYITESYWSNWQPFENPVLMKSPI